MWSSGLFVDFGVWLVERFILFFLDGLGIFLLYLGLLVFEVLFFILEMFWDFVFVGFGILWCLLELFWGLLVVSLVGRLVLLFVGLFVASFCGRLVVELLWGRLEELLVGRELGIFLRFWVFLFFKFELLLWIKLCFSFGFFCCLVCDVFVDRLCSCKKIYLVYRYF